MRKLREFKKYFLILKLTENIFIFLSILMLLLIIIIFTKLPLYLILISLFSFLYFIKLVKSVDYFKIARQVEGKIPELDEKIITYLEFKESKNRREKKISNKLEKILDKYEFKKAYPLRNILPSLRTCIYSLVYFLLIISLFPRKFAEYFIGTAHPPLYLKTEPSKGVFFVPRTITIKSTPFGRKVKKVYIEYKLKDKKYEVPMKKLNSSFTHSISIFEPAILTYHVKAKGFKSKENTLFLKEKPFLKFWRVYIDKPDGKRDTLYSPDKINIIEGSLCEIEFEFEGDFDSGYIFIDENLFKKFRERDVRINADEGVLKFVYFTLNRKTEDIQKIEIRKGKDFPPFIYVIFPPFDHEIDESLQIPFMLYLSDDISLKYLDLIYEFKKREIKRIKNYKNQKEDTVLYNLDLSYLPLLPGDTVKVWFEVADRPFKGKSKISKSKVYRFWIPTYTEIYKESAGEMEEGISFLKGEGKEVGEFLRDLKSFKEKLEKFKEKKETEGIREMVQEIERSLEEMTQRFEEYSKKVENLIKRYPLDAELQEKLFKLKELFKEIMTPEFKKVFEELRNALKQMNPEKLKEAYKNLMLNQELLKEQIERTLELLEKVRQEVKLKEFIERMKRMEEKMEGMVQNPEESSLKDFEELKGKMENLSKEMKELAESFKEGERKVGERLKEAEKNVEESISNLNLSMNLSLQGKTGECKGKIGFSKKSLQKARKKTEKALEELLSMRNKLRAKELEEIFFSAILLSETQSQITEKIREREKDIEEVEREISSNRESLRRFKNKVLDIAKKNLTFPRNILSYTFSAYYKGEELYEKLKILEFDKLENLSEEIKNYLNLLALEILRLRSQGQGGGASQSLLQALKSLSQIAKQQSHINALTQSILPLEIGEAPSEELLKSIQRIAGMQKSLAEKLKEVLETIKKAGGTESLEKGLEKALEEMEKVAKELERGEIKREIIKRQERILSRMLEAQRSIYKREFTKKRYAERPKPYKPLPPPEKIVEEDEIIKRSIIRVLNSDLPYEDKKIFIDYLNSLLK